ncbi:MAG: hypothetical protein HYV05_11155, partial [Deltaproteobacteria bacterium]|nr:hypothetical protein [Deltaproteobacteria bacterium]
WKDLLSASCFDAWRKLAEAEAKEFILPVEIWAKTLYELATTFHHWPKNRAKLVDVISPLYHGRVASFIDQTAEMKTVEAEQVVEEQAEVFEREKSYLLKIWDREEREPEEKGFFQRILRGWRP